MELLDYKFSSQPNIVPVEKNTVAQEWTQLMFQGTRTGQEWGLLYCNCFYPGGGGGGFAPINFG